MKDKNVYCELCDKFLGYISPDDTTPIIVCGDCYLKQFMIGV
jgi:hypothetical protein